MVLATLTLHFHGCIITSGLLLKSRQKDLCCIVRNAARRSLFSLFFNPLNPVLSTPPFDGEHHGKWILPHMPPYPPLTPHRVLYLSCDVLVLTCSPLRVGAGVIRIGAINPKGAVSANGMLKEGDHIIMVCTQTRPRHLPTHSYSYSVHLLECLVLMNPFHLRVATFASCWFRRIRTFGGAISFHCSLSLSPVTTSTVRPTHCCNRSQTTT